MVSATSLLLKRLNVSCHVIRKKVYLGLITSSWNEKGTQAAPENYFDWLVVITLMPNYVQGRLVNVPDWSLNQKMIFLLGWVMNLQIHLQKHTILSCKLSFGLYGTWGYLYWNIWNCFNNFLHLGLKMATFLELQITNFLIMNFDCLNNDWMCAFVSIYEKLHQMQNVIYYFYVAH